jgi:membrane protein
VRVSRMHPRALLTPFTDNVSLTKGDERAYRRQAKAQRSKGFEHIEVGFLPPEDRGEHPEPDEPGPDGSA